MQLLPRTELEVPRLNCQPRLAEDDVNDPKDRGIQVEVERAFGVALQVRDAIPRLSIRAVVIAERHRALRADGRNREVGGAFLPDAIDVGVELAEEAVIEVEGDPQVSVIDKTVQELAVSFGQS